MSFARTHDLPVFRDRLATTMESKSTTRALSTSGGDGAAIVGAERAERAERRGGVFFYCIYLGYL